MPKSSSLIRLAVGVCVLGLWGCGNEVATLELVSITPENPRIGDTVNVVFKLTDYRGQPLAGQNVAFKLDVEKPLIKMAPANATSLKGDGTAATTLVASGRVSSVRVIATAGDKSVTTPPISFVGATSASGRQLTFQCGELAGKASGGRHAIGAYDPSRYLIAGVKLKCFAHVADRNGDGMPKAIVGFITEAGAIGPSSTSQADVVGNAEILYKTSLPFPKETDPGVFVWNPTVDDIHTGDYLVPLWMAPFTWTVNPIATFDTGVPALNLNNLQEPRRFDPIRNRPDLVPAQQYQNNPRDNLVSLVAFTSGEEGFTDMNNDGVHQDEEPFDDLTEPFVDYDDNGTWDPDEKFIDTNNNGKWDGKNGKWDGNTDIWRQERILWTGVPALQDVGITARNPAPSVRGVQGIGGQPITVGCFDAVGVNFIIADPWWNALARNGEGDGCSGESSDVVEVSGGRTGPAFGYGPGDVFSFLIKDKMDRKPAPMTTPPQPGCFPPPGNVCSPGGPECYGFGVPIECKFTASPEEGHIVNILSVVRGRIFKNLP